MRSLIFYVVTCVAGFFGCRWGLILAVLVVARLGPTSPLHSYQVPFYITGSVLGFLLGAIVLPFALSRIWRTAKPNENETQHDVPPIAHP